MATTLRTEEDVRRALPVGNVSFDPRDWQDVYFDTPLAPPQDVSQRARLAPGTCVKTNGNFTECVCGIVSLHNCPESLECIVIGHGWADWPEERFVWRGTVHEFNRTWEVD